MANYNYAYNAKTENYAKAVLRDANISPKKSIEVANRIKGQTTTRAKIILQDAMNLVRAIPFRRFTNGPGHKRGEGMASGRFAVKTCEHFMKLVKQVEANAQAKGMDSKNLIIEHIAVQRANEPFHYGRQTRRRTKRSHVEMVVIENKNVEAKKAPEKKVEVKKEKKAKA